MIELQSGARIGRITGFSGSWMSGLAALYVDGVPVYCDNGQTVRSLDGCYGDVIGEGHTVNVDRLVGLPIIYTMDDMGLTMEVFGDPREMDLDELRASEGDEVADAVAEFLAEDDAL